MQGFNMGKYVPPEHEGTVSGNELHKKHALGARAAKLRTEGILVVRFEVPYAIWCATCPQPTIVGQGVRFNAEKRRAGQYYTTPIWSFRFRHAACGGTIEMRTDPQNTAYVVVSGATRRDTGDDKRKQQELEGGVPILTDAERQELRSNAFASLEKTINDREQLRESSQRIDGLMDVAARQWEDPYALNQKLRSAFRAGRKEREATAAATEALQDRMSLGLDILPETEEDARRARLVDFAPGEDRDAALSKPLFETAAPREKQKEGNGKGVGVTKEARRKMQMKESFATRVMGNTRVAKDPFLQASPGAKRAGEGKAARMPGIKRKRDATGAEDAGAPSKALHSSSLASKGAALVEYDSD